MNLNLHELCSLGKKECMHQHKYKSHTQNLDELIRKSQEEVKDSDTIKIDDTGLYNLNIYVASMVVNGNLKLDPTTQKPHNYPLRSLLQHPGLNNG